MRTRGIFVLLATLGALAGCAPGAQSFSCEPSVSRQHNGDFELYKRPPTRNAAGYLSCYPGANGQLASASP